MSGVRIFVLWIVLMAIAIPGGLGWPALLVLCLIYTAVPLVRFLRANQKSWWYEDRMATRHSLRLLMVPPVLIAAPGLAVIGLDPLQHEENDVIVVAARLEDGRFSPTYPHIQIRSELTVTTMAPWTAVALVALLVLPFLAIDAWVARHLSIGQVLVVVVVAALGFQAYHTPRNLTYEARMRVLSPWSDHGFPALPSPSEIRYSLASLESVAASYMPRTFPDAISVGHDLQAIEFEGQATYTDPFPLSDFVHEALIPVWVTRILAANHTVPCAREYYRSCWRRAMSVDARAAVEIQVPKEWWTELRARTTQAPERPGR